MHQSLPVPSVFVFRAKLFNISRIWLIPNPTSKASITARITLLKSLCKFNVADGLPQRAKAYILENFKVDYKNYDVIVGYRADDSYFSYAGDFVNGTLSLSDLSEAMRLGKLGEQVVLKSKKAFEALTFVEGIKAPREEYFTKYKQRDEEARNKYRKIATKPVVEDETYVIDIIRNNWKNGQSILKNIPRWCYA